MRVRDTSSIVPYGLTLAELLVVMAVAAILLAIAVPSFSGMVHSSRLRGVAEVLTADLRQANTEAIKRGENVSVTFQVGSDAWCYGARIGAACDCQAAGSCQIEGVERVTSGSGFAGVVATPTVSGNRFSFQPRRGTVTAGSVTFTAANGKQLRVVVSGYGRIRTCSPTGAGNLSGYPAC